MLAVANYPHSATESSAAPVIPFPKEMNWRVVPAREELIVPVEASDAVTEGWRQVGTSSYLQQWEKIRQLEKFYTFRNKLEVTGFLEEHPFLIFLLFGAYAQIEKHFGPNPLIFLEVITDPEATDDRELYAFIGTRLPPDEALQRLDRFDKEWWRPAMDRAECKLCIDVEFL